MKRLVLDQVADRVWVDDPESYFYEVKKVTNSTKPRVGERLAKEEVDEYCVSGDWEVSIT